MNQSCRIKTHLSWVAVVILIGIPVYAHAGLYKCVDEKTKAVTYSGTACVSGNESRVSITENAIMDGAAAQREIARRPMANQANQESRKCEASSTNTEEVTRAEDALRTAKMGTGGLYGSGSMRAVRDAQANLEAARDRRDNRCDPGAAQQARAAREATRASDEAREQQAREKRIREMKEAVRADEQDMKLREINEKLDKLRPGL